MQKRKLEKITNYPGVARVFVWDADIQKWVDPERGAKFRSTKYVRDENGRLRKLSKYFDTFAQAKVFRAQSEPKKEQVALPETPSIKKGDDLTFGQLVKIWQSVWLPNKNISTQIRYRSYLKHFSLFWDMKVERIEPSDVDRWIAHIKRPEYLAAGHTTRCDYKHEFSVLRVILNFYSSRYNRNYRLPFLKDHKAMLKVREKMKISKDLTVEEFKRFIDALKQVCLEFDCEVVYYLAMMQYATYCRVQEVAALHYEDFDFVRNRLTVNKKLQWSRAKGIPDRIVDGTKTNGGKEIPIPELAAKVFKEWVMKSGVRSGLLFKIDGELITYRQIEYRYTQALQRIGSPFSATHLLRHASLTEFYATSKDLLLTARMAGQRDIRSTMKYTKVRNETVIQMQKLMDEKLSKLMS